MDARLLSFKVLLEYKGTDRWLKNIRNDHFSKVKPTKIIAKRTIVLTNEVVKWQRLLDNIIDDNLTNKKTNIKFPIRNILRLAIYELLMDEQSPNYAVVNSYVKLSKKTIGIYITGFVNAILRKVSLSGKYIFIGKSPFNIAVGLSYPDWIIKKWINKYGENETIKLCKYFNMAYPMMVRRNRLKIDHNTFVNELKNDNIFIEQYHNSENFYYLKKGTGSLLKNRLFNNGSISFQDRAAGAVVELLNPRPGEVILDACSAPGTKAFYIAEIMKYKGELIASDISINRMKMCYNDSERQKINWINWCIKDAERAEFPLLDRALIDVPCSGTGTIGKNPEIRWKCNKEQIKQLKRKQLNILLNISKYIKPYGVICYSTCSLEMEENWDVIDAFLKLNKKYKIDNAENSLPKVWFKKENVMEIFPPRDKLIGMFATRLRNIPK